MDKRLVAGIIGIVLVALSSANAQNYPSKVVTVVVPFSAGGPTDTVARLLAVPMTKKLNQQVIVENVGGAGGTIGAARVAKAAPSNDVRDAH
jgi:tripartite-type tricarboxylate transporter receptor subunit TctC